ncbi:MAG: FAD-binding oxidoreductase [Gemmatimonadales bacterium]
MANTLDGGQITLPQDAVTSFGAALRGQLLTPDSPGYDEARKVWNAMIDRRPAMIARCAGAADVVQAVRFARQHGLLTAVRGGGHNIGGLGICDGGLLIDLGLMRSVRVDPKRKTAVAEPGVTLSDFDHDTQAFGLATPVGINSTTGLAGLTLGGGFGWLTRKYGLTVDNLTSVDVVTADGELIQANAKKHPDLFWAIRGGGGNFGVVTAFEFKLHKIGPEVMSGLLIYPIEQAAGVLRQYREFVASAPDELAVWLVMRQAPPLPFLDAKWHGKKVLVVAALYAGSVRKGKQAIKPLRQIGKPVADAMMPHQYTQWNAAFDGLLAPGARNYWKSHDMAELSDDTLRILLEHAERVPTFGCEVFVAHMGGAAARVAEEATAYAHREASFIVNVHARWDEPSDDDRCIGWARELFQALAPHATGGVYVNFMTGEEKDRIKSAYGMNYARLAQVKKEYDPGNLFRVNQNIPPG